MSETAKDKLAAIVAGLDALPGTIGGAWKLGYRGSYIACENGKIGGDAKLFDVRGWGYLTGTGHGALGLDAFRAEAIQNAYTKHVINCSPDTMRSIADAFDASERKAEEANACAMAEHARAVTAEWRAEEAAARIEALEAENEELRAERALLQDVLDARPAINAGLPQTYIRWSQSIYSGDVIRAALSARGDGE